MAAAIYLSWCGSAFTTERHFAYGIRLSKLSRVLDDSTTGGGGFERCSNQAAGAPRISWAH